ncbi:RNA polymerase sigma-70 factor [Chitinophaga silvatica]|uniref:RNA polymerase sigma-70 factor n=1 Tax=Chitinophaga silvatica TaxID=2282649 RepID=A0A3E1YGQ3_9BACT|nr:RNA polymerase sigma-70 factor [Chitinophaga silvatica]RFS26556.1 RNA polymerase sigma-70 factor [Chitinophaga silvatica]
MSGVEYQKWWDAVWREDDQASFRQLFNHFYKGLVRFAIDLAAGREAAEEIVSDVFIQLWKNRQHNERIQHIKTYLYTSVRNRCYNHHRDSFKHQWQAIEDVEESLPGEIHTHLEYKEMQEWLDLAVRKLSPQAKTIFRLIREEGFKYKEVATILDISPRTVETQLVRATNRLRLALEQYNAHMKQLSAR